VSSVKRIIVAEKKSLGLPLRSAASESVYGAAGRQTPRREAIGIDVNGARQRRLKMVN